MKPVNRDRWAFATPLVAMIPSAPEMSLPEGAAVATALNTVTGYHTLIRSFERSLVASNFSPHSVRLYMSVLRRFGEFLIERGMPTNVNSLTREQVEDHLTESRRTK